jgi:7-cyano-7-deazaguanine tRNA-ribosyltransferase
MGRPTSADRLRLVGPRNAESVEGFELLDRDGLARLGRFPTPHGAIETPALLPVVHPDPERQPIPAREMRSGFGLSAVITSAYIAWRTPALRERAERSGIHGLLDFDGPVMTDSGAFQQHAYGHVEVGPEEILAFQDSIASDVATVLDLFTEPETPHDAAERALEETLRRARAARAARTALLAVPVQGGLHPDLRRRSAEAASELGDVLAVGGVVPLLEQYRFAELARVLTAARPGLAPERVVHLFGTGHPMTFAFAALFGVDLFDSSSYHKFARRDALQFPEGTVPLASVREPLCGCRLCAKVPLTEVARLPPAERESAVARHNLLECATEVARVRQAIRDGTLWELAERRAAAHPALAAGLRSAVRGVAAFLPAEPESRRTFRATLPSSPLRPAAIRFLARLRLWKMAKGPFRFHPRIALTPGSTSSVPSVDRSGATLWWETSTPLGPVPLELLELYPVGCYLGVEEFEPKDRDPARSVTPDRDGLEVEADRDWARAWTDRHARAILEWIYGGPATTAVLEAPWTVVRSARSGRMRAIDFEDGRGFVVGVDGIPRPTWRGAQRLKPLLPAPRARIVVDPGAVPFVAEGRSLFSRFVRGGDPTLQPGSTALLVDPDDRLLAVGRLLLAPHEMGRLRRGVAVRVTAHGRHPEPELEEEPSAAPEVG